MSISPKMPHTFFASRIPPNIPSNSQASQTQGQTPIATLKLNVAGCGWCLDNVAVAMLGYSIFRHRGRRNGKDGRRSCDLRDDEWDPCAGMDGFISSGLVSGDWLCWLELWLAIRGYAHISRRFQWFLISTCFSAHSIHVAWIATNLC